jgi:hypothetical protein
MGALEYIIGGAAVLISAISLALAISANRTQERLLAASTWPFLQFSTGNRADDGSSAINLNLHNAGVGPARVRTVQIEYSGQYQSGARSLLDACCGASGKSVKTITSGPEKVLTAGEVITFLRFDEADSDPAIWRALNTERFKIRVTACYCSALGDCWLFDSTQADPKPTTTCPLVDPDFRWHG